MAVTSDDCFKLDEKCMDDCFWNGTPPPGKDREDHFRHCDELCTEAFKECLKQVYGTGHEDREPSPRPSEPSDPLRDSVKWLFDTLGQAMDWVVHHPVEATVGTLVLVGGTVYIVSTGGAGALTLVPLAA